ncbi:hypothetical protein V6N13_126684 [Hibiscus sabdariffa]
METFPRDVVVNILSRLPVKYLVQLKCVCKAWQSLISDPYFVKLQLAHNCHRFFFFTLPLGSEGVKVVRVDIHLTFFDSQYWVRSKAEILARKSGIWRKIEGLDFVLEKGPEIFLHGALHWLETRASDAEEIVIVAFDMAEEKFYELVQLPDSMGKKKHLGQMFLMISEDSLCLFCGGGGAPTTYIDAWRLNEYGFRSSWTRLFGENRCTIPDIVGWGNALYYTKSGKIVLDYMGINLMWYDPKENT